MSRHRQYTEKATPVNADIFVYADTEDINGTTSFERLKKITWAAIKTALNIAQITTNQTNISTNTSNIGTNTGKLSNIETVIDFEAGARAGFNKQLYSKEEALTSSVSIAADCDLANVFTLVAAHNATITPSNMQNGGSYVFHIDNSGAYTLSFAGTITWVDGTVYPSNSGKSVVTFTKTSIGIIGSWGDLS